MAIETVSARRYVVPLDRPIHLGDVVIAHRDYVVVEVTTTDGLVGRSIGNARNSPVHLFVRDVIAPVVIGFDPLRTENVWSQMYHGCLPIGQRGALMSALSLLDICCWDIKAQSAGMPLATLLGGYRDEVDVAIAGGYPDLTPNPADVAEEVAVHVAAGYRAIKIAAHGSPADTARLQAARSAIGDAIELMVDLHWSWRDLHSATRVATQWSDLSLTWIEDPFPARLSKLVTAFRRVVPIPLAIGEDRAGLDDFVQILDHDHADYLRADATACGGITEFLRIAAVASTHGRSVSPHVFPEIHVHLAAALPNVMGVETLEHRPEVTPIYRLVQPIDVHEGRTTSPKVPGIGLIFDDEALRHFESA